MSYSGDRLCAYPSRNHIDLPQPEGACRESKTYQCDNCDTWFCADHGTVGGDREDDRYKGGMVAVPSVCWKCGGENADE